LDTVTVVLIVVAAVVALVLAGLAWRRWRTAGRARARREDEIRSSLGGDPVTGAESVDPWADIDGAPAGATDPIGPPAAIYMEVTGTRPWAPIVTFRQELEAAGYETTVELPDLVVVRDDDRRPVTVREPAGASGRLIVTAPPDRLARTLELLVRSLLSAAYTIDTTDGRDVHLTDGAGAEIRLTVTDLARV
jgi:hypothetical protein